MRNQNTDVEHTIEHPSFPFGLYTHMLVFIADSIPVEHNECTIERKKVKLEDELEKFHCEIMGRCDCLQVEEKKNAIIFFEKQFGLKFDICEDVLPGDEEDAEYLRRLGCDPNFVEGSGAVLSGSIVLPEFRYHTYLTSDGNGICNPLQRRVRDGGFCVVVQNVWLYGEYGEHFGQVNPNDPDQRPGVFIQSGKLVYGDFNIKQGSECRNEDDIIIHYESPKPLVRDINGALNLELDLVNEDWGEGHFLGTDIFVNTNNKKHAVINAILTFPSSNVLGRSCVTQGCNSCACAC